uniref:SANT domain-containing protein n=1 Tax=Meloidogyne hapla TaxID=6305 RepID=A0A1I8C0Y3_MELHA
MYPYGSNYWSESSNGTTSHDFTSQDSDGTFTPFVGHLPTNTGINSQLPTGPPTPNQPQPNQLEHNQLFERLNQINLGISTNHPYSEGYYADNSSGTLSGFSTSANTPNHYETRPRHGPGKNKKEKHHKVAPTYTAEEMLWLNEEKKRLFEQGLSWPEITRETEELYDAFSLYNGSTNSEPSSPVK